MSAGRRIDEALKRHAAAARAVEVSDEQVARVMLESPRHGRRQAPAGKRPGVGSSIRRRRAGSQRPPRVVAVGLACLAFAGTALAANSIWDPEFGGDSPQGPISTAQAPIPGAMKRALGVLRRPPAAQDRSPEVEDVLRRIAVSPAHGLHGIRPDSVRYLAPGADGEPIILLLAEKANPHYRVTGEPICVYGRWLPGSPEIPGFCYGLSEVLAGGAWTLGYDLDAKTAAVEGLVPDGVATVTASLVGKAVKGEAAGRTPPLRRHAQVANNYFSFTFPLSDAEYWKVRGRLAWRDPQGKVIRVTPIRR